MKLILLYTRDCHYIDVGLELADPMNNRSAQRLALCLLVALAPRGTAKQQEQICQIMLNQCLGAHYELRTVAAQNLPAMADLPLENRARLLN